MSPVSKAHVDEQITLHFDEPVNVDSLGSFLSRSATMREALRPFLDAAAKPELVTIPALDSDGVSLAEALAKALPNRAPEVYLTLAAAYRNAAIARRFLERFPEDARAGDAWALLLGRENMMTPGAFDLNFPQSVRWLAPFINRGPGYAYADSVAKLFIQSLTRSAGYGDYAIRVLDEQARLVHTEFPNTRVVQAMNVGIVGVLLNSRRPEAAVPYADDVLANLSAGDPLRADVALQRKRAEDAIAAKHQDEWRALWTATVRPPDPKGFDEPPMPVSAPGLLLVTEPDNAGRCQVVALDAATGQRRWTTALGGSVLDLAIARENHRVYCA